MGNYLLGINWEQNSSAALFRDGECLGALSNERISRKKNDESYPKESIDWLLKEYSVDPSKDELTVVFVSKVWAPGWILTRHYTSFDAKDYLREQNDFWYPNIYKKENKTIFEVFKDKLDLDQFPGKSFWNRILKNYENFNAHVSNEEIVEIGQKVREMVIREHLGDINVLFMDHSSCHNAYAYYSQHDRKKDFLSISLDAFGDNINYSAKIYRRNSEGFIESEDVVKGKDFAIGRLYRYTTLILGLKPNEHEYKVMGLAPYCKPKYYDHVLSIFKDIQDVDGLHFNFINRPKDFFFDIREKLFSERFDSIAGGLQAYTEYLILSWVKNLINFTKVKNICYAGGVAMNVKANMSISKLPEVAMLHVPPTPDDTSQAIGACYHFLHQQKIKKILPIVSPYLGRYPSSGLEENISQKKQILKLIEQIDSLDNYQLITENYLDIAAEKLASNNVLGIIWGREEFGARALGNRSIVANPQNISIKKKINERIKDRDFWMPFAASFLEDYSEQYLDLDNPKSSYSFMTNAVDSSAKGRENIPAGLHPYDETCRPQIIPKGSNILYESLIEKFGNKTGIFALLNTSLNLHGSPICSSYKDAINVLVKGDLDGLLTENMLILKI